LLRNALGFPLTPDDGDVLINTVVNGQVGSYVDKGNYIDPLTTVFASTYATTSTSGALISSTTVNLASMYGIAVGQLVTGPSGVQGGTIVKSISGSTITLNKPLTIAASAILTFSPISLTPGKTYYYSAFAYSGSTWTRLGNVIGVSVKDYGTADLMYKSLPEVYTLSSDFTNTQNYELFNFLRIFAFEYDLFKTNANNANNRYDVRELDARLIPALLQEFGFNYESAMGVQQARKLLQYASLIYLTKGSVAGIKRFISAFSGYSASLGTLKNLFLTSDCASFESTDGYWSLTTAVNNTMAIVATDGAVAPYAESGSPSGYANVQKGLLKYTSVTAGTSTISYGISPDTIPIPIANNPVSASGGFVTLNTGTTAHGLSVGQTIIINGLTAAGYNTANTTTVVTAVPSPTSFTYANATTGALTGITTATVAAGSAGAYTANTALTISSNTSITVGMLVSVTGGTGVLPAGTTVTKVTSATSIQLSSGTTTNFASGDTLSFTAGAVTVFNPVLWGIPVTAGTAYTYSIYSRAATTLRSITLNINWYDKDGKYLSAGTAASANNSTSAWTRISQTNITAPTNAIYAIPQITINSAGAGEVHYFDAAQFNTGATALTYADARRIDIYLSANRINLILNPSFETNKDGWVAGVNTTIARNISNGYAGTSSLALTASAAGDSWANITSGVSATVGSNYTASMYVRSAATSRNVQIRLDWYNGASLLSTTSGTSVSTSTVEWTRVSVTGAAPLNTTAVVVTVRVISAAISEVHYFDAALLEQTSYADKYFDGTTGYNFTDDLMWESSGTNSTSRSLYHKNKTTAVARLAAVLPEYLPAWSNWALFTGIPSS
jgi:hypothetical protein